jgi:putative PIN family toxin of toxin-antitoxin system
MRIVVDTNVIVSALVFGGVPRRVVELAQTGRCQLFYSEAIQVEVRRVLGEKFGWHEAKLHEVLPGLWSVGELVVPRSKVNVVIDDPDDDRILECALSARASVVVSGDRHLLRLRTYKSISIVSPRGFMETYVGKQE